MRRSSTGSTTDNETNAESDSLDSSEFCSSCTDKTTQVGSPSSFLNDDLPKSLDTDPLCDVYADIYNLEERKHDINTDIDISKWLEDDCWSHPHETFMDLDDIKPINTEHINVDEDFSSEETSSFFVENDSIFKTANPVDIFLYNSNMF